MVFKYKDESLIGQSQDNVTQGLLLMALLFDQKDLIDKSSI